MGRKRVYHVEKHMTASELDRSIKKLEKEARILKELYFIRLLYKGTPIEEAAERVSVSKATGYNWLRAWNEHGYGGMMPQFGGGRPAKLTREQLDELKKYLEEKYITYTKEIQRYVFETYGIVYSLSQIRRILKKIGLPYAPSRRNVKEKRKEEEPD
jgi:putative transposase